MDDLTCPNCGKGRAKRLPLVGDRDDYDCPSCGAFSGTDRPALARGEPCRLRPPDTRGVGVSEAGLTHRLSILTAHSVEIASCGAAARMIRAACAAALVATLATSSATQAAAPFDHPSADFVPRLLFSTGCDVIRISNDPFRSGPVYECDLGHGPIQGTDFATSRGSPRTPDSQPT
jgi:hypothetical protein